MAEMEENERDQLKIQKINKGERERRLIQKSERGPDSD